MKKTLLATLLLCTAAQAQNDVKKAAMHMGKGCRIELTAPEKTRVTFGQENGGSGGIVVNDPPRARKSRYDAPLTMGLLCLDPEENLTAQRPVRFDALKNEWARDTRAFFEAFGEDLEPEWRKKYDRAIRFYELQAVNAQGFAYTEDDVIGDERGRRRQLFYCLFHAQKAICGESTMTLLPMIRKHPGNDLTSFALRILRSIEFLDESAVLEKIIDSHPRTE